MDTQRKTKENVHFLVFICKMDSIYRRIIKTCKLGYQPTEREAWPIDYQQLSLTLCIKVQFIFHNRWPSS